MKNILIKSAFFALLGFYSSLNINAQTLVSTSVTDRNVVLEEFTGIYCGYCPQAHVIAENLLNQYPGRLSVIAVHAGYYATPQSGAPDYRTDYGEQLVGLCQPAGYPSGAINRHLFSNYSNVLAIYRENWEAATNEILNEVSPVNIGIESIYDEISRELTVNVELYYTDDSPAATNYINVALIQSNIIGPQAGGGMGNSYVHNHMLRHLLTGQWGDEVSTTAQGTFVQRSYTYTIPYYFREILCVAEDCHLVAFVSESHEETYTGVEVPLIGGSTALPLASIQPADGSVSVSTNTDVVISFDQAVRNLDDSEITNDNIQNIVEFENIDEQAVSFTGVINEDKNEITITPSSILEHDMQYTVCINSVENSNNMPINKTSSSFTTISNGVSSQKNDNIDITTHLMNGTLYLEGANGCNLHIYTSLGELVHSERCNNNKHQVKLNYNNGLYIISLTNRDGQVLSKKVILGS